MNLKLPWSQMTLNSSTSFLIQQHKYTVVARTWFLIVVIIFFFIFVYLPCLHISLLFVSISEYPDELWQQANARHRDAAAESTDTLLIAKTGRDRMIYHNRSAAAGLYSVVILATQRDTSLRLYATTTPHSDAVYPPLPSDSVVRVTAVSRDEIAFAWKAPTTAADVQFCVSVSSIRHFRSQCAAHAHRYGDFRPPPPPYAGFGFARENRGRRRGRKHRRRTQSTPAPETTTARSKVDDDSVYSCVGTNTSYTYR